MLVYQVGPRYAGAQAEEAESSQNNWNGQKKASTTQTTTTTTNWTFSYLLNIKTDLNTFIGRLSKLFWIICYIQVSVIFLLWSRASSAVNHTKDIPEIWDGSKVVSSVRDFRKRSCIFLKMKWEPVSIFEVELDRNETYSFPTKSGCETSSRNGSDDSLLFSPKSSEDGNLCE